MKLTTATLLLASLALLLVNSRALAMVVTDCSAGSNPDAKLGTVSIDGCSTSDAACPLVRGQNASISVDFQTTKTFKQAKLEVAGKIGVWLPFPMKPDEACGNYGFNCPVNQNERKKLQISLPVSRSYPKLKLDVRLKLLDEQKNLILCVTFPAVIQDQPRQPRLL